MVGRQTGRAVSGEGMSGWQGWVAFKMGVTANRVDGASEDELKTKNHIKEK